MDKMQENYELIADFTKMMFILTFLVAIVCPENVSIMASFSSYILVGYTLLSILLFIFKRKKSLPRLLRIGIFYLMSIIAIASGIIWKELGISGLIGLTALVGVLSLSYDKRWERKVGD
jgi:hypothetical protein